MGNGTPGTPVVLTPIEERVLRFWAFGLTAKEIADSLAMPEAVVRAILQRIEAKTGKKEDELASWAVHEGKLV